MSLVPSKATHALAARMIASAREEGYDAVRLVDGVERGQELALLGVILGVAAGVGNHRPHGPIRSLIETPQPRDLIACPTCLALIHEPCRTRTGHHRFDHAERLVPRRCPCGEPIPKVNGQKWCPACRVEVDRARKQRYDMRRKRKAS